MGRGDYSGGELLDASRFFAMLPFRVSKSSFSSRMRMFCFAAVPPTHVPKRRRAVNSSELSSASDRGDREPSCFTLVLVGSSAFSFQRVGFTLVSENSCLVAILSTLPEN